jgi:hypothetical protein
VKRKQSDLEEDFQLLSVSENKRARITESDSNMADNPDETTNATSSNPASQLRPFKFLELAAETRNRIYDYLIDNQHWCDNIHDRYLQNPARLTAAATTSRPSIRDHMPYQGLKQASHQINAEFGPLLSERQYNVVYLIDLYTYFDTVRPASDISVPGSQIKTLYMNTHLPDTASIDLLRLIRIFRQHPNLDIRFIHDDNFRQISVALFSTYASWSGLASSIGLTEIRLTLKYRYETLELTIPPITDTLVKDVGTLPKVELAPQVKQLMEFVCRSGLIGLFPKNDFTLSCPGAFGVHAVGWNVHKGPARHVGIYVSMFKNSKRMNVPLPWNTKPWQWYLEARPVRAGSNGRHWDAFHVRKLM